MRALLFALSCSAIALSTAGDSIGEVLLGNTLSQGMNEGASLLSRMEALSNRAEEAMTKNQDASEMLPRKGGTTSIHKTFHPSPGAEVTLDVEINNQQEAPIKGKGLFAVLQQRMQRMRKKLSHRINHWHMPGWVHKMRNKMSHRARFRHTMRMRKMWMRATLEKQCKTELKMCPHFPCPMRVAKCLRRRHASKLSGGCSSFVNKMKELRDGRKSARKAFRRARRRCRQDSTNRHRRHRCIRKARKEKFAYIHGLFSKLQAASQQQQPQVLEQMVSQAKNLFDLRMKKIKEFKNKMLKRIDGMRTANMLKSSKTAPAKADDQLDDIQTVKNDIDEYVNDPAVMAKKHWTAKIAKLKAAYFMTHQEAFRKMKQADEKTDKSGTTRSQSELSEAKDSKTDMNESTPSKTDMNESAPDFLTGDIEAPKGERDMGGWVMRVYTTEQQQRLHVDEMGKPVKEAMVKPVKSASWANLCVAMICGGFVLLILILCIKRKRQAARQAALGNIYNELAVESSKEQV